MLSIKHIVCTYSLGTSESVLSVGDIEHPLEIPVPRCQPGDNFAGRPRDSRDCKVRRTVSTVLCRVVFDVMSGGAQHKRIRNRTYKCGDELL